MASEQAQTGSGEIRMHRLEKIPTLEAAVDEIKTTIREQKNLSNAEMGLIRNEIGHTQTSLGQTNTILLKIGNRLYLLNWALTILGFVGFFFGVVLSLGLAQKVVENKELIERLEKEVGIDQRQQEDEQVREDERNRK